MHFSEVLPHFLKFSLFLNIRGAKQLIGTDRPNGGCTRSTLALIVCPIAPTSLRAHEAPDASAAPPGTGSGGGRLVVARSPRVQSTAAATAASAASPCPRLVTFATTACPRQSGHLWRSQTCHSRSKGKNHAQNEERKGSLYQNHPLETPS